MDLPGGHEIQKGTGLETFQNFQGPRKIFQIKKGFEEKLVHRSGVVQVGYPAIHEGVPPALLLQKFRRLFQGTPGLKRAVLQKIALSEAFQSPELKLPGAERLSLLEKFFENPAPPGGVLFEKVYPSLL
jgi:hypothetical protein